MKLKSISARVLSCVAILVIAVIQISAQESPEKLPTKEDLANNNKLFIELATKYLHWDVPTDPIHIVAPPLFCRHQRSQFLALCYFGRKHFAEYRNTELRSDDRPVDQNARLQTRGHQDYY